MRGDVGTRLDGRPEGRTRVGMAGGADPVGDAGVALASVGAHVLSAALLWPHLQLDETRWARFAAHWEDLGPDRYAADAGTHRLRRYGQLFLDGDGSRSLLAHDAFRQPTNTNRLFPAAGRDFEPLTDAFLADPVLDGMLLLLSDVASSIAEAPRWRVHVHPFRVVASTGSRGEATPEGRHQDGVTLVSSLLVTRRNVTGGRSSVFDGDGQEVLSTTLEEPATLLVGDDRRTWHSVSPIRPVHEGQPAHRDVLVVTFTAC